MPWLEMLSLHPLRNGTIGFLVRRLGIRGVGQLEHKNGEDLEP
jgi:hypothetical protein